MDDSDFKEPPTKQKTTLRFASPVSPSKMDMICQGYVPPNTKKATSWAVRAFEQWRDQQNEKSSPSDLLEKPTADSLNRWLPCFVVEARRENGKLYPPSRISNLLASLYRYSKECNRDCLNFMNRKDPTYKELTGTLEVTCRELRREGVGANVKHAAVFSLAEENALLDLKVISDHAPVALQRGSVLLCWKGFLP